MNAKKFELVAPVMDVVDFKATADHAAAREDENVPVIVPPAPAVTNPPEYACRELPEIEVS